MAKERKKKLGTSSDVLDTLLSNYPGSTNTIIALNNQFAHFTPGETVFKESLLAHMHAFSEESISVVLDYFIEEKLLVPVACEVCKQHDSQINFDEEMDGFYCDLCDESFSEDGVDLKDGYLIEAVFKYRKTNVFEFEEFDESDEFCDFKKNVLRGVPSFMKGLRLTPPIYLKNKDKGGWSPKESDFRDDLLRAANFIYYAQAEALIHSGRCDLAIRGEDDKHDHIIGEFKIWPSNDFKRTIDQLLNYFTEFDDVGFTFIVNPRKTKCIADEYRKLILKNKSYVRGSIKDNPLIKRNGPKHFLSKHKSKSKVYSIYHFIFDVHQFPTYTTSKKSKLTAKNRKPRGKGKV